MKIIKAIEILTGYIDCNGEAYPPDFDDAIKLGNEALKRLEAIRNHRQLYIYELLPGEDPE